MLKSNQDIYIGAIIVARLSSKRLPRKCFLEINGFTILEHIIARLKKSGVFDQIVIATSDQTEDDDLSTWALQNNLGCFRGSLEDVRARFVNAMEYFDFDFAYRANADSPFPCSEFIEQSLQQLLASNNEFLTGKTRYTKLPMGSLGEWISKKAACDLLKSELSDFDKEHITSAIFTANSSIVWDYFHISHVIPYRVMPLVVDTEEDYQQICDVFADFGKYLIDCSFDELVKKFS